MEPLEWTQILATLDMCVNKVIPIKFCDENGLDLIPFYMVNGIQDTLKQNTKRLKKQDMGPFVINSISPSGAIKLARHRKEQQVHTTTNRANKKKVLSQQAQEEGKELNSKRFYST